MAIKLTDLIRQVSPEVEGKVKRVRDQTRPVLQEALRSECRLVMRIPKEAEDNSPGAQVRVEVAPGYPVVLRKVEFSDDQQRRILVVVPCLVFGSSRARLRIASIASGS